MNKIFTICATGIVALAATTALAGDGYYSYTGPGGGAYRSGGVYAQEPTNSRATNPRANKNAYQQMMGQISGAKEKQLGHDPIQGYYENQDSGHHNHSGHHSQRGYNDRGAYTQEEQEPYYGGNKNAYERMVNRTSERREALREQEMQAMEAESRGHGEGVDTSPYAKHRDVFRSPSQQVRNNDSDSGYGRYGR